MASSMMHKKIPPEQLGFDFDGVIADVAEAFIRLADEQYGLQGITKDDITHFDVDQCLAITPAKAEDIFHQILVDSIGTGLKPIDGAVEVLTDLAKRSSVTVITARPLEQPVHDWLRVFFPQDSLPSIHVVAMGAHDDKARHIRANGIRYFIDDRAETCVQLEGTGIQPIVFSQPWNKNRHQLPMVSSWQEIKALCCQEEQP